MASLTTTEFADFLKEYYDDKKLENIIYPNRPFLALLDKNEKFVGKELEVPINYAHNQGISADFTTAQSIASSTTGKYTRFSVTRAKFYGFTNIDTELLEASDGGKISAYVDAKTAELDGMMEELSNRLEGYLFGSGWGDVGRVATSGVSGSTITLATTSDVHKIAVGQQHVFASTQASSVLAGSGGYLTVTGVNRSTGVITYDAAVSTVTGVTDGYWIFRKGDRQNSASPSRVVPVGLEAWSPYGGASSTSFFGVDRTTDSLLSGLYHNGASEDLEDAISAMANKMAAYGVRPTHCFISFGQFAQLVKNVRADQRFYDKVTADVGFSGVNILCSTGPVKVVPSHNCPGTRAYVVDLKKLELWSLGKSVKILDHDGNMFLRNQSSDSVECRMGFRGNLVCRQPNAIGTIQLTAVGV